MSSSIARILVVDDDQLVRQLILQALQRDPSYELKEAASKAEALAMHLAHPFDLVLTDLRMEQVDAGVDLLQNIKRHSPDTVVIVLTAYATLDSAIAAVRANADDYLLKPISMSNLTTILARALGAYRTRKTQRDTLRQIMSAVEQLYSDADGDLEAPPSVAKPTPARQYLEFGAIKLDMYTFEARIGDGLIDLTATEFALLRALVVAHSRTVTFEQLVLEVYQQQLDRESARSLLASHIRNLRRKLGPAAGQLVNVRGIGYYLAATTPDESDCD